MYILNPEKIRDHEQFNIWLQQFINDMRKYGATTIGDPLFDKIVFNTEYDGSNETEGGTVYWNPDLYTLNVITGLGPVIQLGQELYVPVWNNTGSQIDNGITVYPSGTDAASGLTTVDIADASVKAKCRLIGTATMDIPDSSLGLITLRGTVRDLNTAGMTGAVFLKDDGSGGFQQDSPTGGSFPTIIGAIGVADATAGTIVVDPLRTEFTAEVIDTNGFSTEQRTNTDITFDDSTRTFTISASSYPFHYYILGVKYEIESSESVVIDDTDGPHIIYYDGDTLTALASPTGAQISEAIRTKCLVAYMYWDSTHQRSIPKEDPGDERHGYSMSPYTHNYLHFTRGAQYGSGLALSDINADQTGSLDEDSQFSVSSGAIYDEDYYHAISDYGIDDAIVSLYKEGASGTWHEHGSFDSWQADTVYAAESYVLALTGNAYDRGLIFYTVAGGTSGSSEPTWQDASGAVDADGGDPCGASTTDNTVTWVCVGSVYSRIINYIGGSYRPAYNYWNGSTWSQAEVGNLQYVIMHLFGFNYKLNKLAIIQGQDVYGSISAARTGANEEISNLTTTGLPAQEFVPIASLIFQGRDTYLNYSKARIRTTDLGDDYVNWTQQEITPGSGPGAHSNLTGLLNDDHPQYIKDSEFTQDSGILVGTGAGTFQEETGSTLRTSIGIGAVGTWADLVSLL